MQKRKKTHIFIFTTATQLMTTDRRFTARQNLSIERHDTAGTYSVVLVVALLLRPL